MWRQMLYFPRFCIGFYTTVFMLLWLIGWVANAVYNTHFDLDRLRDMYAWIMTQVNANHAINSIWNSPKGCHPDENVPAKPDSSSSK